MPGVSLQPVDGSFLTPVVVSTTATSTSAPAGVASQFIRVYKLFLVATGATNIQFQDGTTALTGAMALAANSAVTLDLDGQPWFTCSSGNAFTINNSGGTQVSGTIYYTQTPFK